MDVEQAIRERRTHKAFFPEPVPKAELDALLDLGRWAPNHHLTNPWRFRVLGPGALERLKEAAGQLDDADAAQSGEPGRRAGSKSAAAAKLDRAPTLVAVTVLRAEDPVQDEEDLCAAACATYAILLGAHARGLAGYWRTPGVLRTDAGRAALGIGPEERFVALIHLGRGRQDKEPPERAPARDVVTYLD